MIEDRFEPDYTLDRHAGLSGKRKRKTYGVNTNPTRGGEVVRLVDLQNKAIEGYPDPLGDYYDPKTGKPTDWHPGNGLEWFIANEIAETYNPNASDLVQVREALRVIERAIEDLQGVANALFRLEHEVEAEE